MVRLGPTANSANLEQRGHLVLILGDLAFSVQLYGAAQAQSAREGSFWPGQAETVGNLRRARDVLAVATFDNLWSAGQRSTASDLHDIALTHLR
jgi:hypothetical protein